MSNPRPTTIDFETFKIQGRPVYPPMPVGVSIKHWGKSSKYYAFAHADGNNCCWSEAKEALQEAYKNPEGILFQNGKFDVDVAEEWFGVKPPKWELIHDTMFLLFLDDPHQINLGLKPSSERLLGMKPDEQDAVGKWLIANQPLPGKKISASPSGKNYFGAYIAFAPGKIVGKYANGDVNRTVKLFKLLYKKTVERKMLKPYRREQELMPILLEMERQGIQVDIKRLRRDVKELTNWWHLIDLWVINRLKASADMNIDSGAQLMSAMIESGAADPTKVPLTPTGKYQTNKDALLVGVSDKTLLAVLKYRTQMKTCLNTFMKPWLATAELSGGLIYTTWNQVKAPKGKGMVGTRTGRLSSTPNFQNIPNTFQAIFKDLKNRKLAKCPWKDLPELPKVRSYIIPFKGETIIDRDYSQQELRILGHFDGGLMLEKYLDEPWLDFHDETMVELHKIGKMYQRKPVKNTNFGLIYGMGVGELAKRNEMSVEESKGLKNAILTLYPGLKIIYKEMKLRAKTNTPIRTWGGREYYCEPPKLVMIRGSQRMMSFDYKLVNILVQGSAADCTKEALIRFARKKLKSWRIVLNVHDQISVSVPHSQVKRAMEVLRKTMESIEFDVPMLSEGSLTKTNWQELVDYDKKGELL